VNIRGGSPERGRQTTVGLSTTATFSVFAGYFSDTLEMRPALLYGDMQSVVGFSVIPKCVTLNGSDWLFRVKFCFRPLRTLLQNTCVFGALHENLNEDRPVLSMAKIAAQ